MPIANLSARQFFSFEFFFFFLHFNVSSHTRKNKVLLSENKTKPNETRKRMTNEYLSQRKQKAQFKLWKHLYHSHLCGQRKLQYTRNTWLVADWVPHSARNWAAPIELSWVLVHLGAWPCFKRCHIMWLNQFGFSVLLPFS